MLLKCRRPNCVWLFHNIWDRDSIVATGLVCYRSCYQYWTYIRTYNIFAYFWIVFAKISANIKYAKMSHLKSQSAVQLLSWLRFDSHDQDERIYCCTHSGYKLFRMTFQVRANQTNHNRRKSPVMPTKRANSHNSILAFCELCNKSHIHLSVASRKQASEKCRK